MGLIRLLLALAVVAGHSGGDILGIPLANQLYAVSAFFIISGFYMAMILNQGYTVQNFYLSRAIRIYPLYYVGCLLAIAVNVALSGFPAGGEYHSLSFSSKVFYFISNAIIFLQDLPYLVCLPNLAGTCATPYQQLVIPAWSIAIELMFYLLAPFIVKSHVRSLLFTFVGAAYLALVAGWPFPVLASFPMRSNLGPEAIRFFAFPATFMYFGCGILAYRYANKLSPEGWRGLLPLVGLAAVMSLGTSYMPWREAALFAAAVPLIFTLTKTNKLDRWLGDLSYPIYILHFPIYFYLKFGVGVEGNARANATAALTVALSVVVVLLIDKPLEVWRHRRFPAHLDSPKST